MSDQSSTPRATLSDLSAALHSTLKYRGVLDDLSATVRTEIYHCLNQTEASEPPTMPNENLIINTLILEYLSFNQYTHAASVLRAESGMPSAEIDVAVLGDDMGVVSDGRTPLLYGVVEVLKSNKRSLGKEIENVKKIEIENAKESVERVEVGSFATGGGGVGGGLVKMAEPAPFIFGEGAY